MNSVKISKMTSCSSVDRAPAWCSGGHEFDSCWGLRFFSLSHARVMFINSSFTKTCLLNSTMFNCQYNQHVSARTGELNLPFCSVQVQVGRLGRSKRLFMSAFEVTSTSCVVEAAMPPDAIRW